MPSPQASSAFMFLRCFDGLATEGLLEALLEIEEDNGKGSHGDSDLAAALPLRVGRFLR